MLSATVAAPCAAQQVTYEVVEEEDVVTEDAGTVEGGADRFVTAAPAPAPHGIARFGPFRVIDAAHAALVDVTDERSPAAFAAMLRAYPALAELDMIECPGTLDDVANLRLGRMIRAHGMVTRVPDGGSVRSGAVELFLAGTRRIAERRAEFAVHAWEDSDGHQPGDFSPDAPANRAYLDYYREMGMSALEARAFYDMTNKVPNSGAHWMNSGEMAMWVRLENDAPNGLASLDSVRRLR